MHICPEDVRSVDTAIPDELVVHAVKIDGVPTYFPRVDGRGFEPYEGVILLRVVHKAKSIRFIELMRWND